MKQKRGNDERFDRYRKLGALGALGTALLLTALLAGSAWAGEGHKCTADTQTCLNMMARNLKGKGWVGVELEQDEESGRMRVTSVVPDSPAEHAGMQAGDVLLAMDGLQLTEENKEKTYAAMKAMSPGHQVHYTVDRPGCCHKKGGEVELDVVLGEIPDRLVAEWLGRHMLDHAVIEIARE